MRIHSDKLLGVDIYAATQGLPGVSVETCTSHGSRKRDGAYEVKLSGTSSYDSQGVDDYGQTFKAATWDEWGIFIARLFAIDPEAIIGQYKDLYSFEAYTQYRFDTLDIEDQHKRHKWEYDGSQHSCKCGARLGRM